VTGTAKSSVRPSEIILPPNQRYQWAVKFTCVPEAGNLATTFEKPGPFTWGTDLRTVVNIHNFKDSNTTFWKKAVLARSQRHYPGPVSPEVKEVLTKGKSLGVDCRDFVNLFPESVSLNSGDGFLIIRSRAWLDVQVFYSARSALSYEDDTSISSAVDSEDIWPRIIVLGN
jgi:hypothetical protein